MYSALGGLGVMCSVLRPVIRESWFVILLTTHSAVRLRRTTCPLLFTFHYSLLTPPQADAFAPLNLAFYPLNPSVRPVRLFPLLFLKPFVCFNNILYKLMSYNIRF